MGLVSASLWPATNCTIVPTDVLEIIIANYTGSRCFCMLRQLTTRSHDVAASADKKSTKLPQYTDAVEKLMGTDATARQGGGRRLDAWKGAARPLLYSAV